jgi:hypothetical protein
MPAFAGMTGVGGVVESIIEGSGMTGPRPVMPVDDHAQWSPS